MMALIDARAPLAAEAVRRIDAIFAAERTINGLPTDQRLAIRQAQIAPLVAELEGWTREQRARMSRHAEVGKAMNYMLTRWDAFGRQGTPAAALTKAVNDAADHATIVHAPGPVWTIGRYGSIAAHCTSLSQKSADTVRPLPFGRVHHRISLTSIGYTA